MARLPRQQNPTLKTNVNGNAPSVFGSLIRQSVPRAIDYATNASRVPER